MSTNSRLVYLPCNDPWPSCSPLHSVRTRSCLAGISLRRVRCGHCPWSPAPGLPGYSEGRTSLRTQASLLELWPRGRVPELHCSRPRSSLAAGQRFLNIETLNTGVTANKTVLQMEMCKKKLCVTIIYQCKLRWGQFHVHRR